VAEQVGTLLWEMRTAGNWSLGRLAQKAGVDKSALSRWETGSRQPRVAELEAVLDALNATTAQRAQIFARIEAPRALRHLRQNTALARMGAPPNAGELLRALRLRRGWSQMQLAGHLGVHDSSIARWERGERLPSTEQIQALCYALEAHEEELIALTTERFTEASTEETKTWEEKSEELRAQLFQLRVAGAGGLEELRYLSMERVAWEWAQREEQAKTILADIYVTHAQFYRNEERWGEIAAWAQRSLSSFSQPQPESNIFLRGVLMRAAAAVYAGSRPAPERGLALLKPWAEHSTLPAYTAWMLSDMAKYAAMEGRLEAALPLAEEALQWAQQCVNPVEAYLRRYDYGRLLAAAGRVREALDILPDLAKGSPSIRATSMLTLAEVHLKAESVAEAQNWLQQAQALIEEHGLEVLRPKLDALMRRV
jgi:transcriptional regulator with XRE-family HTH domain